MNRRGSVVLIVVLVAVIILIGVIALPVLIVGNWLGGGLDKATGAGGPAGYGCYVADQYFTDTSVINKQSEIINKISAKWPAAKTNEKFVKEVFEKGKRENINPLIPLAIWAGEQSFNNPNEAFGYGNTDSGNLPGTTGWSAELAGVYRSVKDTVNISGNYQKPTDANRFTRLFYNYTTAMRVIYESSGNVWSEEASYIDGSKPLKNRLAVFRLVAEDQITCQRTLVASARSGNDGVPLYKQRDFPQPYGSSTIAASGCCTVSATMVLNFLGISADPVTISNLSATNGYYVPGSGTNHSGFYPFLAKKFNLNLSNLGTDWNAAMRHLSEGRPIIARGQGSEPYTSSGHCIVLTGYDRSTGMVRVNNPASGDGPYPLNQLKRQTTVLYLFTK
jgi:hypothetical protein